jgi:hypothetical protein
MTGSPEDFEDHLRRVLDAAARQLRVSPAPWPGPTAAGRVPRSRLGGLVLVLGAATVVVVVAVAFAVLGHGPGQGAPGGASASPPPPAPARPHLSPTEGKEIGSASRATTAHDRACRGFSGPRFATGSPAPWLTANFGVLRRTARPADTLPALYQGHLRGAQHGVGLYGNYIRLAQSAFGGRFYVMPAANVTEVGGIPARCAGEEIAVLKRQLRSAPPHERTRALNALTQELAYTRYLERYPQGICATWVSGLQHSPDAADNLVCDTWSEFRQWGVLVNANAGLDRLVFCTLVPDRVATVTLRFAGGSLLHPATLTVRPVNNVVVAQEPYPPGAGRFPSHIVLRAADGHVIKSFAVNPTRIPTQCSAGC